MRRQLTVDINPLTGFTVTVDVKTARFPRLLCSSYDYTEAEDCTGHNSALKALTTIPITAIIKTGPVVVLCIVTLFTC